MHGVCVCVCVRKQERQSIRQTDRQTDRQTGSTAQHSTGQDRTGQDRTGQDSESNQRSDDGTNPSCTSLISPAGNNVFHVLVVNSLVQPHRERQMADSFRHLVSILPEPEVKTLLLTENDQGLRPLELAAHVGTFLMFEIIMETKGKNGGGTEGGPLHDVRKRSLPEFSTTGTISSGVNFSNLKLGCRSQKEPRVPCDSDPGSVSGKANRRRGL